MQAQNFDRPRELFLLNGIARCVARCDWALARRLSQSAPFAAKYIDLSRPWPAIVDQRAFDSDLIKARQADAATREKQSTTKPRPVSEPAEKQPTTVLPNFGRPTLRD